MPIADLVIAAFLVAGLIIAVFLAIAVAIDAIRSPDLSGVATAAWILALLIVPLLGSLVYVIVRGDTMQQRADEHRRAAAADERARNAEAAHMDVDEELRKLTDLRDRGVITPEDFDDQKARLLT